MIRILAKRCRYTYCIWGASTRLLSSSTHELNRRTILHSCPTFIVESLPRAHPQGEENRYYSSMKMWKWLCGGAMFAATGVGSLTIRQARIEEHQEMTNLMQNGYEVTSIMSTADPKIIKLQDNNRTLAILEKTMKKISIFIDSYKRRVFFKYEQRLRLWSSPCKIFKHFSSVTNVEGQAFMTSSDLMRATIPVFPLSKSTYIKKGHLMTRNTHTKLLSPNSKFSMLFDGDGLISYSEYIFFRNLLSVPEKNLKAMFETIDIEGKGALNKTEFKTFMSAIKSQHRQGVTQCDGKRHGFKISKLDEENKIVELFFGQDGTRQLTYKDLEKVLEEVHHEIKNLEFAHYDVERKGTISARDFALSIVVGANLTKLDNYLDRVDNMANNPRFDNIQITLEEFHRFAQMKRKLPKLVEALESMGGCHKPLTKEDVGSVATQVWGVALSHGIVEIIYYIFASSQPRGSPFRFVKTR